MVGFDVCGSKDGRGGGGESLRCTLHVNGCLRKLSITHAHIKKNGKLADSLL